MALVQGDGRVHLQSIQLGRDFGNSLEVLSGLRPEDSVITNPTDSITEGALVEVQPSPEQPTGTQQH